MKLSDLYEQDYGLPPGTLTRIAKIESGGDPNAVSPVGARGVMQVMPASARDPGFGIRPLTEDNDQWRFAAEYLGTAMKRYGGDVEKAVASYNAGMGAVDKYGGVPPFPETQGYVKKFVEMLVPQAQAQDEKPLRMSDIGAWQPPAVPESGEKLRLSDIGEWKPPAEDAPSMLEAATKPITDIPDVYQQEIDASLAQMQQGAEQLKSPSNWDGIKGLGNIIGGGLDYLSAPITAPIRSIVGNPVRGATGSEMAGQASELAATLLIPGVGMTRMPGAAVRPPAFQQIAPEAPRGPLGSAGAMEVPAATRIQNLVPEEILQPRSPVTTITGLNLSRISSSDDVKSVLQNVEDNFPEINAARGAPITWKQTEAEVEQLFQGGLTLDDVLKWKMKPGEATARLRAGKQLVAASAEEVTQLAKAAAGGDETALVNFTQGLDRHRLIWESFASQRAEAGRQLQVLREMTSPDAFKYLESVGWGRDRMQQTAQALVDMAGNPQAVENALKTIGQPNWWDKVMEIRYNSMLSGWATHLVNVGGNVLTQGLNVAEMSAAKLFSRDVVVPNGFFSALPEAWNAAKESFRTEMSVLPGRLEARPGAIPGKLGRLARLSTRAMSAEDSFFQTLGYRTYIHGAARQIAAKEGLSGQQFTSRVNSLIAAPTDDMMKAASEEAQRLTFTNDPGDITKYFMVLANKRIKGAQPFKIVTPFIRTPGNILRYSADRTPLGFFFKRTREQIAAGGAERAKAFTRIMMGTTLGGFGMNWALDGRMTGRAPSDPERRRVWFSSGYRPYSIKIGNRWLPYQRVEPFGTILGWAADAVINPDEAESTSLIEGVLGMSEALLDKSYLSGLSEFIGMLNNPSVRGDEYIGRLLASGIPFSSAIRQMARIQDPTARVQEGVTGPLQAMTPGLSQALPPQRDIWGQPIEAGRLPMGTPVPQEVPQDRLSQEMLSLDIQPSRVPSKIGDKTLTPAERGRWEQLVGEKRRELAEEYLGSPNYQSLSDEHKKEVMEKIMAVSRRMATEQFKSETHVPSR